MQKSLRAAIRVYKDQGEVVRVQGGAERIPTLEEFLSMFESLAEGNKRIELNKLRTPSLRELFEHVWSQKLRNYTTQELLRSAYEGLVRRLRARARLCPHSMRE